MVESFRKTDDNRKQKILKQRKVLPFDASHGRFIFLARACTSRRVMSQPDSTTQSNHKSFSRSCEFCTYSIPPHVRHRCLFGNAKPTLPRGEGFGEGMRGGYGGGGCREGYPIATTSSTCKTSNTKHRIIMCRTCCGPDSIWKKICE